MLHHSSNIGKIFSTTILEPFRKIYEKRGFAHWFVGEGPDSGIFGSADAACASILQNYADIEIDSNSD